MANPQPYPLPTEFKNLWHEIKKILDYLVSPELQSTLSDLKIVFLAASLFFVFCLVFFLFATDYMEWHFIFDLKSFLKGSRFFNKKIRLKWQKIKKNLNKAEFEPEWKLAVIEAVEIFDKVLKRMEYSGETFVERVAGLNPDEVSDLENLIKLSEVCQDLIKDPDYQLTKSKAKEIIEAFEKALVDLGVL